MSRSLNVVAADDEQYMRDYFQELLPRLGHKVAVAASGRQMVELCRAAPPDLVIADVKMPDMDGIEAAGAVNRERSVPVILVTAHREPELRARARDQQVMAYLVKPVKEADLEAAIELALARFEQVRALQEESAGLRQSLAERKVIERAKGALMKRLGVDEQEAFRRLRKLSSDQNKKLIEMSRRVIDSEEVFQGLDRV